MQDMHKIHFIAANYRSLQGLRAVPIGMLLLVVVIWANAQQGPASDLTLPIMAAVALVVLAWGIARYYQTQYGRVVTTPQQKRLETIRSILGGAAGLAAFILDTTVQPPFSCVGLVFAAAIAADLAAAFAGDLLLSLKTRTWRMQQLAKSRYLLANTLISTAVLVVLSLPALFGLDGWWQWIGLRSHLLGILGAAGVILMVSGLWGHWAFVRLLPALEG
jgi:hypothetical protein